jgi:hypothetical protein
MVAVSSISLGATIRALERSMEQARFASVLLLSDQAPPRGHAPGIEWRRIRPIRSRQDYSGFMLHELSDHITSDFALCVQWDGFVLDGRRWRDEFLQYDYIGAPWPHFDHHRVGNGGFSLRSKRLLEAAGTIAFDARVAEDIAICRDNRNWLEKDLGLRFAPEALAREFAFERLPFTGREFGFHGIFNMRRLLQRPWFIDLLSSLDPGTIGRLEVREIVGQSLLRLDLKAAWLALRNRIYARRSFNGNSR